MDMRNLIISCIVTVLTIGVIISGFIRWIRNKKAPLQAVHAQVVNIHEDEKCMPPSHHERSKHIITTYHASFMTEDGDTLELKLSSTEFSCLSVNDKGTLVLQGERYVGFHRD